MLRYKLRTLLILLAIGPPLLATIWPTVKETLWPPKPSGIIQGNRTKIATPTRSFQNGKPSTGMFGDTLYGETERAKSRPIVVIGQ